MSTTIYRLISRQDWETARAAGAFTGSADDRRDGFIHLSTATQVATTAARHYAGQHDLLLLYVRASDLGAELRWEPSRGGALFPHLYGALPASAVYRAEPLPLASDGLHVFPDALK
jgi:uncharacterized protein (DUF952 family)